MTTTITKTCKDCKNLFANAGWCSGLICNQGPLPEEGDWNPIVEDWTSVGSPQTRADGTPICWWFEKV